MQSNRRLHALDQGTQLVSAAAVAASASGVPVLDLKDDQ
jgi:hypothetical protein